MGESKAKSIIYYYFVKMSTNLFAMLNPGETIGTVGEIFYENVP